MEEIKKILEAQNDVLREFNLIFKEHNIINYTKYGSIYDDLVAIQEQIDKI